MTFSKTQGLQMGHSKLQAGTMSQEFVQAAMAGESSAWNILYRQHEPWLYAIALRICGNTPAAKDAVQDTFMIAFLKLPQLKDHAAFAGWIKKICVHSCYRSLQRNHHNHSMDTIPPESDSWWENELDKKLDDLSSQAQLFDAMVKLPEVLRSTLLLRYYTSYQSYEQIAGILCIPVGTVRSRLNQAKTKMSEHWKSIAEINDRHFHEAEHWNRFYYESVGNSHYSLDARNKFLNHLNTNTKLVFSSGKADYGRRVIARQIEEDIFHGSRFGEVNIISNGNISVVEAQNINSVEYPDRCPVSTILVLYRDGKKVTQANLHNAARG